MLQAVEEKNSPGAEITKFFSGESLFNEPEGVFRALQQGAGALAGKLRGDYRFAGGEFAQNQLFKLNLLAGIIDIDAH